MYQMLQILSGPTGLQPDRVRSPEDRQPARVEMLRTLIAGRTERRQSGPAWKSLPRGKGCTPILGLRREPARECRDVREINPENSRPPSPGPVPRRLAYLPLSKPNQFSKIH